MSELSHDCGPHFKKLLADVERVGWHVVLVRADEEGPGFGYTVGVFKTFKLPEIIMLGLKLDVIHPVLNGIVEDMKKGTRFERDKRYANVIEGYDCVFRRMHTSHFDQYLGQAVRFYGGSEFPVLQCIWPDKERRFPWDEGASAGFRRQEPLLDTPWPFKELRNVVTITTRRVIDEGRPIVIVTHDEEDGCWQFLCDSSERDEKDARVVSLQEIFDLDPTVGELADLPLGWRAWRDAPGATWHRERREGD